MKKLTARQRAQIREHHSALNGHASGLRMAAAMADNAGNDALETPTGKYTMVGSIPVGACDLREATVADEMAGRAITYAGRRVYPKARAFDTVGELRAAVEAAGGTFCSSPNCACRHHEGSPFRVGGHWGI